jgi:hypothetical protein
MMRLHLPSGTTCGLDFLIPDDWSADQALAIIELLDDLRERICMHYRFVLHGTAARTTRGSPEPSPERRRRSVLTFAVGRQRCRSLIAYLFILADV